jgi:UDP-N-acetylglucosamine 2-epimerase
MGARIAHIEAGLHSYRRGMAEEINRVVTDHLSDVPTASAMDNLLEEGLH